MISTIESASLSTTVTGCSPLARSAADGSAKLWENNRGASVGSKPGDDSEQNPASVPKESQLKRREMEELRPRILPAAGQPQISKLCSRSPTNPEAGSGKLSRAERLSPLVERRDITNAAGGVGTSGGKEPDRGGRGTGSTGLLAEDWYGRVALRDAATASVTMTGRTRPAPCGGRGAGAKHDARVAVFVLRARTRILGTACRPRGVTLTVTLADTTCCCRNTRFSPEARRARRLGFESSELSGALARFRFRGYPVCVEGTDSATEAPAVLGSAAR